MVNYFFKPVYKKLVWFFIFIFQTMYMAIVVYTPALALSQCEYQKNYVQLVTWIFIEYEIFLFRNIDCRYLCCWMYNWIKFAWLSLLIWFSSLYTVTGFDVDAACAVIFIVCIFYTTIVSMVYNHYLWNSIYNHCRSVWNSSIEKLNPKYPLWVYGLKWALYSVYS